MRSRRQGATRAGRSMAAFGWLGALLALATLGVAPGGASAQREQPSVRLDQYRMAETPLDGFAASRPGGLGHLRFGARLDIDYALDPLVYRLRGSDPSTESAAVVEHLLGAQLGASFGLFDRLVIYAGLPVNLVLEGAAVEGQPRADGSSLGDVYFGARGRLFGEPEDAFALAVQLTGTAPTARAARFQSRFAGEGGWTVHPELLFEVRIGSVVRITGNVGALVRDTQDFGGLRVGHELTWAAAVGAFVVPDLLELTLESWGSSSLDERFGQSQLTPVEAVLGARLTPAPGLRVGLAAGTGLTRGYGAGELRAMLSVGYATAGDEPAGDEDADGITDDRDACPGEPEDLDGHADGDGCPDPDNDADGTPDGEDACPDQPEDADGLGDEDGCPEEDFDEDGAPDETDRCPTEPGVALAPRPECTGCPTCDEPAAQPPAATSTSTSTSTSTEPVPEPRATEPPSTPASDEPIARVTFGVGSFRLRPSEREALEAARSYLAEHPSARLVIEGHADDRGNAADNMVLSQQRARRVTRWFVRRGVDESRLSSSGCSERHPLEENRTPAGRRANRRVELRAAGAGPEVRPGCERTQLRW